MKVLFDSNILIDYLNGVSPARDELQRYHDGAISIISYIEILVGVRSQREEEIVRAFLRRIDRRPLTEAVAEQAVVLRREHRLRLPDAIIWATAQVDSRLFITRNTRDFPGDFPGVRIPYVL